MNGSFSFKLAEADRHLSIYYSLPLLILILSFELCGERRAGVKTEEEPQNTLTF